MCLATMSQKRPQWKRKSECVCGGGDLSYATLSQTQSYISTQCLGDTVVAKELHWTSLM